MTPITRASPYVLFTLWAAAMTVICSYLLARHLLTLPTPAAADPGLVAAIQRSRAPAEQGRWLALHVLLADCGCSRRVADHLVRRGPLAERALAERVILIRDPGQPGQAPDLAGRLRARGFAIEELPASALPGRYPIEAAPLLLVADPAGAVRYLGGYSARKQGPTLLDAAILRELLQGRSPPPLPAFGCPATASLRAVIDPLRLSTTPPSDNDKERD